MSTRRAVVVVTIFLLLTGFAAAVNPRPLRGPARPASAPSPPPPGPLPRAKTGTVEVRIDAGTRRPPERRVPAGAHVILTVSVGAPGDVALQGFDLLSAASPEAPAMFDLLATRTGRYRVLFTPVTGGAREIGTLVVPAT